MRIRKVTFVNYNLVSKWLKMIIEVSHTVKHWLICSKGPVLYSLVIAPELTLEQEKLWCGLEG